MHVDHVATGQDDQSPKKPQKFYQILYVQVIFAIVAGILLGHFFPDFGESLKLFDLRYLCRIELGSQDAY